MREKWSFVIRAFIRVILHHMGYHQGGLSSYGLSSGWSFIIWATIRGVSHMGFDKGDLSPSALSEEFHLDFVFKRRKTLP